jgi:hypothetical protein
VQVHSKALFTVYIYAPFQAVAATGFAPLLRKESVWPS